MCSFFLLFLLFFSLSPLFPFPLFFFYISIFSNPTCMQQKPHRFSLCLSSSSSSFSPRISLVFLFFYCQLSNIMPLSTALKTCVWAQACCVLTHGGTYCFTSCHCKIFNFLLSSPCGLSTRRNSITDMANRWKKVKAKMLMMMMVLLLLLLNSTKEEKMMCLIVSILIQRLPYQ